MSQEIENSKLEDTEATLDETVEPAEGELSDDELEQVAGGWSGNDPNGGG